MGVKPIQAPVSPLCARADQGAARELIVSRDDRDKEVPPQHQCIVIHEEAHKMVKMIIVTRNE